MAGRSNKYNKLWRIVIPESKKEAISFVRFVLDSMNAIYAEEQAEMNTYLFYLIGTQHRFMSICENLGSVKIQGNGCVISSSSNEEETNED